MFLASETCRNELFSNYHKLKKIREVTVIKFEKIVFFCDFMTIEQDMGSNFLSEHLIILLGFFRFRKALIILLGYHFEKRL